MSRRRLATGAYAATLFAFVVLSLHGLIQADLPQYTGKAMSARLVLFPLALLVVPVGWIVARRRARRRIAFPFAAATLLALPFAIDLFGNAFSLYVEHEYYDDFIHWLNPVLGVAGLALLLDRTSAPRWSVWTMAFGLGCAAHITFEITEYALLMGFGAVELGLTLRDTLFDLGWGTIGAAVGASVVFIDRDERASRPHEDDSSA